MPTGDRWRSAVQAVFAAVFTLMIVKLAAAAYYDPRPFVGGHVHPYFTHPADNGFPSDHTAVGSLAGYVLWSYRKRIAAVLWVAAVLVGAARVVAHVHSPVDIIGALVISAIGSALGLYLGGLVWNRWQARTAQARS
nr:phosphatase PAP2 family protein [Planosporangium thailandense]